LVEINESSYPANSAKVTDETIKQIALGERGPVWSRTSSGTPSRKHPIQLD
jgi:hypothetical protein